MAIPDYQTLMLPVLQLAGEGEQRVADVVDLLADRLGLTEEERQNDSRRTDRGGLPDPTLACSFRLA